VNSPGPRVVLQPVEVGVPGRRGVLLCGRWRRIPWRLQGCNGIRPRQKTTSDILSLCSAQEPATTQPPQAPGMSVNPGAYGTTPFAVRVYSDAIAARPRPAGRPPVRRRTAAGGEAAARVLPMLGQRAGCVARPGDPAERRRQCCSVAPVTLDGRDFKAGNNR